MPEGWTVHIHPEGKPYFHRVAMDAEDGLLIDVNSFFVFSYYVLILDLATDSLVRLRTITLTTSGNCH